MAKMVRNNNFDGIAKTRNCTIFMNDVCVVCGKPKRFNSLCGENEEQVEE